MVHIVLFDGEDHFEAALGRRGHAGAPGDLLPEETIAQSIEPAGKFLTTASEQLDCLSFAALHFFIGDQLLHQRRKIESIKRGAALFGMNLILKCGSMRNM